MNGWRQLRVPTIDHNYVIFGDAKPVLDGLIEFCIKALTVLLIGYPESALAFSYPDLPLIRQNVWFKAVCIPVLGDLINSSNDPRRHVLDKPMLIVKINRRESYRCTSDMSVNPGDHLKLIARH